MDAAGRANAQRGGARIGRYIVIEELGRGGMGVVVRGYDPKLRREVAIKLLRRGSASEEMRSPMIREARTMAKLNHAHVVGIYDQSDNAVFVRMAILEMILGRRSP